MPVFDFSYTVNAPVEAVDAFHRDTRALKRLTPPPVYTQIHKVEPLAEGSISKFTMWFGPLPVRWTAVHSDVSANGFTDTQVEGPSAKWVHAHRYTAVDADTTRMSDHIEYEHKPGAAGLLTRILFAKPNLFFMFTYRRLAVNWYLRSATADASADASASSSNERP